MEGLLSGHYCISILIGRACAGEDIQLDCDWAIILAPALALALGL